MICLKETDPDLVRFSIAHDEEDVIPLTRKAIELNPDLKLFLSPWSAPGWMKTSGSMITGQLKHEYYPVYAEYFAKTIKAYGEHGLPVHAVTPQNEALYEPGHYPGMLMPAEAQADFIKNHLKPAFVSQGIQTKILCYDHNWDEPGYPLTVLEQAGEDVDGVAWHWYGVKHRHKQRCIKRMLERKYILQKDQEGMDSTVQTSLLKCHANGIQILRNYSKSFVLWNMALDENNGPTVPGFGRSTCRGIVQVNQQTGELVYTLDYYALAHFSAIIRPQAVRIESSSSQESIYNVAFRNKDGSIAVVLFNEEKCPKISA